MENKEENIEEVKEVLQQCKLEEDAQYQEDKRKDKNSESFQWYMVSFIPYLMLIFPAINGVEFFMGTMCYGLEAIFVVLCFSFPIYLGLFIFQIIYTIKKYKTFTKKQKIIPNIFIILIIVAFLGFNITFILSNFGIIS